jgi:hypothetical protein
MFGVNLSYDFGMVHELIHHLLWSQLDTDSSLPFIARLARPAF